MKVGGVLRQHQSSPPPSSSSLTLPLAMSMPIPVSQLLSLRDGLLRRHCAMVGGDKTTGNWWLRLQDIEMGYWPKELIPSLEGGADVLTAGGEIYNSRSNEKHTGTQMGSDHFSSEGFKRSSFLKNVQVLDSSYSYSVPEKPIATAESPNCYDIQVGKEKDGSWGYFFFYGGPGSSEKCT
ncbi:hypothetical protein Taro_030377 [Colocasia esculenta]|uniref:Neprosin PEP catalytic domain-containing protein n=1 Tax=Colocasia esculenta TaxID=4460 RepID=A0A843VXQ4_COLES|nr:hypothetical protein [Colocasia esculenta]